MNIETKRTCIVVPTIREQSMRKFLAEWASEFSEHVVVIVEDNPEKTFDLPSHNLSLHHYAWQDIEKDLGKDSWIIPRRTDCIRSFGFFKAVQFSPDVIITLDDDCYPSSPKFVETHRDRLMSEAESEAWVATGDGAPSRGMPYRHTQRKKPTAINHGLWTGIPDFDAVTQLSVHRTGEVFTPKDQVIPSSMYFPMCGMNLSFKSMVLPAMYFLLMGKDRPYDRFGDIWCGIMVKRICDHLGYYVRSGLPYVEHQRASDIWTNLRKELAGYEVNERLWAEVDNIRLTGDTFRTCYKELASKLNLAGEYWTQLKRAMQVWADLFED